MSSEFSVFIFALLTFQWYSLSTTTSIYIPFTNNVIKISLSLTLHPHHNISLYLSTRHSVEMNIEWIECTFFCWLVWLVDCCAVLLLLWSTPSLLNILLFRRDVLLLYVCCVYIFIERRFGSIIFFLFVSFG